MLARGEGRLRQTANDIASAAGQILAIPCDVSQPSQIERAYQQIQRDLGTPTILVNNAGLGGPFHRLDEVSYEEWELIFSTNVKSVFTLCRLSLPLMKSAGFGRIVNIASIQAHTGASRSSTYVASKHAVVGYTKAIAAEWGRFGITCNAISPGYLATDMGLNSFDKDQVHFIQERIPVQRMGTPDEIADLIVFLTTKQAAYLNGCVIVADGGLLADLGSFSKQER